MNRRTVRALADVDPVAIADSRAILAGNEHAMIVEAGLRGPGRSLSLIHI